MSHDVLLAHPGTQYSHQLARQLYRTGCLHEFWTGVAISSEGLPGLAVRSLLPSSLKRMLANRLLKDVPSSHLRTMPLLELKALRSVQNGNGAHDVFFERNKSFQERIPQSSIETASIVVGFDTSSWILAERVIHSDKPFLLDQSIAHPRVNDDTARRLAKVFPEWNVTLENKLEALFEIEAREHKLATKVIVASTFTKRSLIQNGVPETKIVVNPYGVDLDLFEPAARPRPDRPIRFLFVGAVSARKGIPLLIDSWEKVASKEAELWLVGPISDKERALIPDLSGLTVKGKYPLEELPALMKQCDVFVFPSYCEGFALVLLEAMASGLPVITTEATAGPDLFTDGVEGFLIPSGDEDALSASIRSFITKPEMLAPMSQAARQTAERFSWDNYGDRWREILQGFEVPESAA